MKESVPPVDVGSCWWVPIGRREGGRMGDGERGDIAGSVDVHGERKQCNSGEDSMGEGSYDMKGWR